MDQDGQSRVGGSALEQKASTSAIAPHNEFDQSARAHGAGADTEFAGPSQRTPESLAVRSLDSRRAQEPGGALGEGAESRERQVRTVPLFSRPTRSSRSMSASATRLLVAFGRTTS